MGPAPPAVLAQGDAIGVVALGLVRLVVPPLALLAGEGHGDSDVSAGHVRSRCGGRWVPAARSGADRRGRSQSSVWAVEVSAVSERASGRSLTAFAGVFGSALLAFLAVGCVLPVLPRYVHGPLHAGDVWVGVVTGAFAFTAVVARPVAGRLADRRGRRAVVAGGALLVAIGGALYFIPGGLPGLLVARLVLGAGEGTVFTAGATWVVDLAPLDRRARVIGLYGLAVWGGLALGPLIGTGLFEAGHFDAVWAFCAISPAIGAVIALLVPDPFQPSEGSRRRQLIVPESVRPGLALAMATVGYAAMAS